MKFGVGDSVEVLALSVHRGEVGVVVLGASTQARVPTGCYRVKFADGMTAVYAHYEIRHSQQKLPVETDLEREVRLEEGMNADLIERRNVRGITPPDY